MLNTDSAQKVGQCIQIVMAELDTAGPKTV